MLPLEPGSSVHQEWDPISCLRPDDLDGAEDLERGGPGGASLVDFARDPDQGPANRRIPLEEHGPEREQLRS